MTSITLETRQGLIFSGESDKTQKLIVMNKEKMEAATYNDTCVHSSRIEDEAVGECGKKTKTTDQPSAKRKSNSPHLNLG